MQNIMNEYIKITKNNMNQYMKLLIENRYIKNLSDSFIDIYTEIRYYGLIEVKKGLTVKNKISMELRKNRELLVQENPDKIKNIDLIYAFLDSCISLNETSEDNLENEIQQIITLRKQFAFQENLYLSNEIKKLYKECDKQRKELLKSTESEKFFLKYYTLKTSNFKKVKLKHNLKFPAIYSRDSINKAFNSGITAEDKLFVEYYLITAQIIKDIQNAIYRKMYLVEFTETILEKSQKLIRLLEIINHPSIQDRAIINITYNSFSKYKDKIYELLRKGFKFAITIDEAFEINDANMQRLTLFQYIFVNSEWEQYESFKRYKLKNIIEI